MTSTPRTFFEPLVSDLVERAARATVSLIAPANAALGNYLRNALERLPGPGEGFLAPPMLEALFEWSRAGQTLEDLRAEDGAAERLIHPDLVAALDGAAGDARFPRTRRPYVHQVAAWRALRAEPARSVIVSTGTSSGKTECFLIPILDSLTRNVAKTNKRLEGVEALFLYPLNALINSQRDRLDAWTAPFKGKLRFCLYNGLTKETVSKADQALSPNRVLSREELRASPPPILVTNATMLEFMLVRGGDADIIEKSKGKLRWIVIDEAHTYVGSRAAEIALLLRRVLHAFGSHARDVRFIATSATISSTGAEDVLRDYVADLAGIDPSQVSVVTGKRSVPELPGMDAIQDPLPAPGALASDRQSLHAQLARVPAVRQLRKELAQKPLSLAAVTSVLAGGKPEPAPLDETKVRETLQFLDAASAAQSESGDSLLPLRAHLFHRAQPGLWTCCNPSCKGRAATPLEAKEGGSPAWRFGRVYFEHRERCLDCQALVLELGFCTGCGTELLAANDAGDHIEPRPFRMEDDEGGLGDDDEDDDEEPSSEGQGGVAAPAQKVPVLIAGRVGAHVDTDKIEHLDPVSGAYGTPGSGTVTFQLAPKSKENPERSRCPSCGFTERRGGSLLRGVRLGATFYLATAIPGVLERLPVPDPSAEKDAPKPADLPLRGRRLLTFTDSRQGTASFATRLQLDAERRWTRSFVYHTLAAQCPSVDAIEAEVTALEHDVSELKKAIAQFPGLANQLGDAEKKLAGKKLELANPGVSIPWPKMLDALGAAPAATWIFEAHQDAYRAGALSASEWARICLTRELVRRPRRATSLETLGLVALSYPTVEKVNTVHSAWKLGLPAWRDFLTLTLDFFVRVNGAVALPMWDLRRWFGSPASSTRIVEAGQPAERNRSYAWPSIKKGRIPRMGSLLFAALELDKEDPEHRDIVDALLARAWDDLMAVKALEKDERGYFLELEKTSLRSVSRAWKCPVTGRLVTTVLNGYSPYQVGRDEVGPKAIELEMPRLKYTFPRGGAGPVDPETVRAWLATDPHVKNARELGVWTELSDRIAAFVEYLQASEHSAQIRSARLARLETAFRHGKINVLGCSTTMEMGVDIGGLSAVVMNNAPPGPANFLQRSGRAGRRSEPRALTLTFCQASPHGEAVFKDPSWPFTMAVHVPKVSLTSRKIVQRHVQALALARFMAPLGDGLTLSSRWFFVPDGSGLPRSAQFRAWLTNPPQAPSDPFVVAGIKRLVHRSGLEGASVSQLLNEAAHALSEVAARWEHERKALLDQLDEVGGLPAEDEKATPAQKALKIQLERLEGEYLLRSLASDGFLPAYGFPLHVIPFVNTTAEQLKQEKESKDERDRADGFGQRRSYPSRPLPIAIREYAPGCGVVLDGAVYESKGVTLNWHLPPGDKGGAAEIQDLKFAVRCKTCGHVEATRTKLAACPRCNKTEGLSQDAFLRPAGFAVDIRESPSNDLSTQRYVVPLPSLISASGASWLPLSQGDLARYRHDPEGCVLSLSRGPTPFGYAVCLRCGRAEPEKAFAGEQGGESPLALHKRLRGGKKKDNTDICPGGDESFAVKRNLMLGGDVQTDVVEIQLKHPTKGIVSDVAVTTTLAVAYRAALARHLGIEPEEIGWATTTTGEQGEKRRSIVLFDTAEGGAGYVGQVPALFVKLTKDVRDGLNCPRSCDRACHACLLRFDTQREQESLDRKAALVVLDQELILALQLPEKLCVFGDATRFEPLPLPTALAHEVERSYVKAVRVHVGGDAKDWDIPAWPVWKLLKRLALEDVAVSVVLPESAIAALYPDEGRQLASRLEGLKTLIVPGDGVSVGAGKLVVEVGGAHEHVRWAVVGPAHRELSDEWGVLAEGAVAVRAAGVGPLPPLANARPPKALELEKPGKSEFTEVPIGSQLDGPIFDFGTKLWKLVGTAAGPLTERLAKPAPITKIRYSDRYLRSPLNVRLLYEVLRSLNAKPGGINKQTVLTIDTTLGKPRGQSYLYEDWVSATPLVETAKVVFGKLVAQPQLTVHPEKGIGHWRELEIAWGDGVKLLLRFDSGMGFMRVHGYPMHPFKALAETQAASLLKSEVHVENDEAGLPIYVRGLTLG